MSLSDEYEQKRKVLLNDAELIDTASDYVTASGHAPCGLIHGKQLDMTARNKIRIEWVLKAESEFIEKNKQQILSRAAEMCREYAK